MSPIGLYVILTFFVLVGAYIIDHTTKKYENIIKLIVLLVLWFFYALSNSGTDYEQYLYFYSMFEFSDLFSSSQEVGYIALNCILKMVIKNPVYGVVVIKTITFCLNSWAIFKMKDKIEIGTAIFVWFCLQYFSGYLIAMSLAASLVFLGTSFWLENKKRTTLCIYLLAFSIHYSAIVIIAFYIANWLIGNNRFSRVMKSAFFATLLIITGMLPKVVELGMEYIPALRKYSIYTSTVGTSIGFVQVIFYVPVWLSLLYLYRNNIRNSFGNFFGLFVWQGFAVAMMGYIFGIFDRMFIYFIPNFVLLIPYVLNDRLLNVKVGRKAVFKLRDSRILIYIYAVARLVIFLYEHYTISGLDKYTLLWQ